MRTSVVKNNLIYDLGLHKGEDSDFYLRKGFKVVAFEASPQLIASAEIRFGDAIKRGDLCIVQGAIAPASAGDTIVFYENPSVSVWGTIKADWASRNDMMGHPSQRTEVRRVDIAEVFRTYGIPYFLKIDVEGVDRLALEELTALDDRPQYISMESEKVDFSEFVAELDLLRSLGYAKFKIVQQESIPGTTLATRTRDGQPLAYTFESHSSGPFGEDLPQSWLTYAEAIEFYRAVFVRYKYFGDYSAVLKLPRPAQRVARKLYRLSTGHKGPLPGWFDTHASL